MIRCKCCVMPPTRPDTPFVDGVCSACLSYQRRTAIDWAARRAELIALLDRHDGRCIVPSSGGKDSTYQVLTLKDLGADVTIVTARTCHLTEVGRANIDNLSRYARTIEVVPNMTVRAKLNRLALERVGDISWPEHAAIFSAPFKMAIALGIPLLFYGECPQTEYGGPQGSDEAMTMTRRWITEFGGFLGLRPADFVGEEGITERDMLDYTPPAASDMGAIEAHFLGQYLPWDSRINERVARHAGMRVLEVDGYRMAPTLANWWIGENLDNAQTGIHDYFMWLKYGFGRGCQQISVDVRRGALSRDAAMVWVNANDGHFPEMYAGVPIERVLDRIGMKRERLHELERQFKTAVARMQSLPEPLRTMTLG